MTKFAVDKKMARYIFEEYVEVNELANLDLCFIAVLNSVLVFYR